MQQSFIDVHPYLVTLMIITVVAIYGYIVIKILEFFKWVTIILFRKGEDK